MDKTTRSLHFETASLKSFRKRYPEGDNYVAAEDVGRSYERGYDNNIRVKFVSLKDLIKALSRQGDSKNRQRTGKS